MRTLATLDDVERLAAFNATIHEEETGPLTRNLLLLTAFAPLVLGERSVEDIHRLFPDLSAYGRWRLMLDVLFPRFESFLNPAY